jgi:hypothetical protein
MFARPPRKIAVPSVVGTCPSCDGDVPAGNRFCGICGAPAREVETEQPTGQELATQRHAALLGEWLEPDVKRFPRLRPALLVSVLVPLLLAGAYVVFQGKPAEPLGATATTAVLTSGIKIDSEALRDSTVTNVTPVPVMPRQVQIAPSRTAPSRPVAVRRVELRTASVVARATGVLQMLVTPWASVSIDGRAGLRRARGADTLVAGIPHRLHFARPGFATIDTTVTLRPGEQRLLEVQMTATKP